VSLPWQTIGQMNSGTGGGGRPGRRWLSWNATFLFMSKKGNMVIFRKKLTRFLPQMEQSCSECDGSGIGGSKKIKQWHGRDLKIFRGKSMILITFRGTEEILSCF
jgi:hypothetical protein